MGKVENIIRIVEQRKGTLKAKDVPASLIKRMEDLYGKFDYKNDFFSSDLDTYFKTKSINKETGGINHSVIALASFEESLRQITSAYETLKDLLKADEAKNDSNIREVAQDIKMALNKYRAHLRKFYPEQYRKYTSKMNEGLISPSKVIALNDKRAEAVTAAVVKEFGIKDELRLKGIVRNALSDFMFDADINVDENTTTGGGAGSASFTPGTGVQYATPYAFRRPKKKQKPIPENLNEGIDTGEGVDLDAYGYKLVPKNKAGNYVQKGSKLDVKQLFEDQKDFQAKRVAAFDVIEQELNDIYKMLSNAKNETSDYYNDNPSSYNVIKPTDLVLDYIKDIKDLLKGE